jgi:protein-tyrosine phosphatase
MKGSPQTAETGQSMSNASLAHRTFAPRLGEVGGVPGSRADIRFRILFVCTGNLCRSPIAERLTRAALGADSPVVVESAGVRAVPGTPMSPESARVLAEMGADPGGFASRRLTCLMLEEADLVLTATREHRGSVVRRHPRVSDRAFTIIEFGVLAEALIAAAGPATEIAHRLDPADRASAIVAEARALRGLVRVDALDIPDPFGGLVPVYRTAARRISVGLSAPLKLLTA